MLPRLSKESERKQSKSKKCPLFVAAESRRIQKNVHRNPVFAYKSRSNASVNASAGAHTKRVRTGPSGRRPYLPMYAVVLVPLCCRKVTQVPGDVPLTVSG